MQQLMRVDPNPCPSTLGFTTSLLRYDPPSLESQDTCEKQSQWVTWGPDWAPLKH